jgi:hypothetical protein
MERNPIEHVNVKVFARSGGEIDPAWVVPVFHRWIQESACEELLVDVANYGHVPAGPGVVLVGHEANYSLDLSDNLPGLLYNRKAVLGGSAADNIAQALGAALDACARLEREPLEGGGLHFDAGRLEVSINDRLLAPNTEEAFLALRPALEEALARFYGSEPLEIGRVGEPRERLRMAVSAHRFIAVPEVSGAAAQKTRA